MLGLDNPLHLALLALVLLLVFGAKRLPEVGRSLGSGIREFKDSVIDRDGATMQHAVAPPGPAEPAPAPSAVASTGEPMRSP